MMNIRTQLAWILAIIFATLFVIVTFLWVKDEQRLHTGVGNISATKDQIRQDCERTDEVGKAACAQDLQDLSDMLSTLRPKTESKPKASTTPTKGSVENVNTSAAPFTIGPGAAKIQTTPVQ